jgi:tripartite-type tricarboxylate transporter receptor subunit TctC
MTLEDDAPKGRDEAMMLSRLVVTALAAACLFGSARTHAQSVQAQEQFPNRLVTVVAPITPGTAIDILARLYADQLS